MKSQLLRRSVILSTAVIAFASCGKDENELVNSPKNAFRQSMAIDQLKDTTNYVNAFTDNGVSTVDMTIGNNVYQMFRAIDAYGKSPASSGNPISAEVLNNMFTNTNNPYSGNFANLNTAAEKMSAFTGINGENRAAVIDTLELWFEKLAAASAFAGQTGGEGTAGILTTATGSRYLVDDKGIEWIQVILKALIGAYQLDHISNTLLVDRSLDADNTKTLAGKNYSQLEQNWDQAYATLTTRPVYGSAATNQSSGESFMGTYIWEYNKDAFPSTHINFLKGRGAIVNGDRALLAEQANKLREQLELTMAKSAVAYLSKFINNVGIDNAVAAHAMSEGMGFIYGLRFCKIKGGTASFSDDVLNDIGFYGTGIWSLTAQDITRASNKIKSQFNL